jgi:integrase
MNTRTQKLTDGRALALPTPHVGYVIHWCAATPGFGCRVTKTGARAWISERRVNGKTKRVTLGRVDGRNAISADAARKLMLTVSSELQLGIDRAAVRRTERQQQVQAATEEQLTLAKALREYVAKKRRAKDGLALKARTKADYLAMIEPGKTSADGRPFADGALCSLAEKPLAQISGDDIARLFASLSTRGPRRQTYAMQVLRAVLNWHGVAVPDNPLGREVAGKDRIPLAKSKGDPSPIPPEKLAPWWNEATAKAGSVAADLYRLMLLTGARGGELKAVKIADVDLDGARITLRDTKNRTDHTLLLAKQAVAIVAPHASGKKAGALLFDIGDPRKTLQTINRAAEVDITPHDLRATFASVAEELVSAYSLKRMLNHSDAGDVTGGHYVAKSETQLRTSWQAVADFIAGPSS